MEINYILWGSNFWDIGSVEHSFIAINLSSGKAQPILVQSPAQKGLIQNRSYLNEPCAEIKFLRNNSTKI